MCRCWDSAPPDEWIANELRLDAIVYRAKFVPTIWAARQFVNHGHVNVNGRRTNIGSFRCKPGDVIEVREKSKQLVIVLESVQLAERDVPDYIEADHSKMTAKLSRVPVEDIVTWVSSGFSCRIGSRM